MEWLAFAAVALAGFVQGSTGFGFALVATPVLLLVHDPTLVVPLVLCVQIVSSVAVVVHARAHARPSIYLPIAAGGVLGIPPGVAVLQTAPREVLGIAAGSLVVSFAISLATGFRMKIRRPRTVAVPVGMLAGMCGASLSINGPPIVLFLANQDTPRDVFRGSIAVSVLFLNVFSLSIMAGSGLLTGDVATTGVALLPFLIVGIAFGLLFTRHIPEARFRLITLAIAGTSGFILIVTQIAKLA